MRRRLLRVFVRRGLLPGDDAQAMGQWAHGGGFSVDASVRIEAADRAGRERLLRYCARPPFALDRLRELDPERLLYDHQKAGPGGHGPLCLTPLELLDRLAALVPPPRVHRHRYFGVLAPNAPLRAAVTALAPGATTAPPTRRARAERPIAAPPAPRWAMLLARIYEVFPLVCPRCGDAMRGGAVGLPTWRRMCAGRRRLPSDLCVEESYMWRRRNCHGIVSEGDFCRVRNVLDSVRSTFSVHRDCCAVLEESSRTTDERTIESAASMPAIPKALAPPLSPLGRLSFCSRRGIRGGVSLALMSVRAKPNRLPVRNFPPPTQIVPRSPSMLKKLLRIAGIATFVAATTIAVSPAAFAQASQSQIVQAQRNLGNLMDALSKLRPGNAELANRAAKIKEQLAALAPAQMAVVAPTLTEPEFTAAVERLGAVAATVQTARALRGDLDGAEYDSCGNVRSDTDSGRAL